MMTDRRGRSRFAITVVTGTRTLSAAEDRCLEARIEAELHLDESVYFLLVVEVSTARLSHPFALSELPFLHGVHQVVAAVVGDLVAVSGSQTAA